MAAEEIKNNSSENCLIHLKGINKEGLHIFTERTFTKFKLCRLQWLKLSGVSSEIPHQNLEICGNEVEESDFCKYFYHKYCYRQFTDISKLKRAETKMQKHIEDTQEDQSGASVPQAPATPSHARKRTRSTSTTTSTTPSLAWLENRMYASYVSEKRFMWMIDKSKACTSKITHRRNNGWRFIETCCRGEE